MSSGVGREREVSGIPTRLTQPLSWLAHARDRAWDAAVQRSSAPILIGPFRGEVGFEALYWIPYVLRWRLGLKIPTRRCRVIARGGTGRWYDVMAGDTSEAIRDLYDLADLEECRIEQRLDAQRTGMLKQTRVTAFDRRIIAKAAKGWGLNKYWWLHPSRMFRELTPWWEERAPVRALADQLHYDPMAKPELPADWRIPREFVAVRFYARATFPIHPDTINFTEDLIQSIASRIPVVLLNSGLFTDDHQDFEFRGDRIVRLPPLDPVTNLWRQAAVLSRATAFVGTYGGFAQLALRLGIPSYSFYYRWGGTARAHLWLSQMLSLQSGVPFHVAQVAHVPLLRGLLAEPK